MLTGIQASTGYEIMATANLFVVNYFDSHESWKVSELVTAVRQQIYSVKNLELILNLEELTELNDAAMKSVWQISRMLNPQGIAVKCVLPKYCQIPALDVFAVNGFVELYSSVDEIIYEDEAQETWSHQVSGETFVW